MGKRITKINSPENLNPHWDTLADCYFQKREFLSHLHKYNPCSQRYYELYNNDKLIAATLVYTLKINFLTFLNVPSPVKMQVIGLPASVAAPPIIGDPAGFDYLLNEILNIEKGLILGLNFTEDLIDNKVLNMRTLPTVVLRKRFESFDDYKNSLRHTYRRRLYMIQEKFSDVRLVTSDCSEFTRQHYSLYLEIMKRTKTKLETLSFDVFHKLPSSFVLNTFYANDRMLCFNIMCKDDDALFFFFGGLDYELRDHYHSYNNSLLEIVKTAINEDYETIDLGQTAEIAKTRLGAELEERRMILYHKNSIIFYLLKMLKKIISNNKVNRKVRVFKLTN